MTEVVTTGFKFLERKREMSSDAPSVQNKSDSYDGWGNTSNYIDESDLPFWKGIDVAVIYCYYS